MPKYPTVVWVNDFDLAWTGFVVESVEQSGGTRRWRSTALPGAAGHILVDRVPEVEPRRITVTGYVLADSVATARTNVRTLLERCGRGLVELRWADEAELVRFARLEEGGIGSVPAQIVRPLNRVTLTFVQHDTRAYALEPTMVAIGATRTALPLGTSPSPPVVQIMGTATNPVLTYRGANGSVLGSMGFTASLGTNDWLSVDMDAKVITSVTDGNVANGLPLLSAGDFFAFDPAHGDAPRSVWPTLEVSSGSGAALYRKAYL